MDAMSPAPLPTGRVTFVFTDIEGSTHALHQLGDRYGDLLSTYTEVLCDTFTSAGGIEFGTEGDALFFAFEHASAAVEGALAGQLRLQEQRWPGGLSVRVRMGIHTGEASLTPAGTYVGLALHLAARICSAAHGGQVVLSDDTVADVGLSGDGDGDGVVDLGHHRLKDFPDPVALYQLAHARLPRDFPRLRSDAAPGNLPKQITRFVGRRPQLREASEALTQGRPLVTLTGPGGAGKTRLALEVASEMVDEYPHGAWLVELASVTEGDLVAQTVASAIGVRDEPGRGPVDALVDALRTRRALIVLDNCEHLVAPCADLATHLLRSCPGLQVLATSQEALGVTGEAILVVPSLDLRTEAVELFIDRARLHRADFDASAPSTAELIGKIVARLDGIPLAIELASARVGVLSVQQIAARLDDQFRLLTGGSRAALPRQRTLRAAVDWSYSLLSDDEQRLLRHLAVFAGGFSLEGAEAVGGGDVLDVLARLVARSLVIAEEQDGEARYRLLETIRQYAQDKLAEADELAEARARHLEWFRDLALEAEPELTGPEQAEWLARLDTEVDNLRAAMEWSAAQPAGGELLLTLAVSLWRFWLVRGHWNEGRSWLARGLELTPADDRRGTTCARALAAAGDLATEEADYEAASRLLQESLELWRALAEPEGVAKSLNHLGNLARARFEYDAARGLLTEALRIRREEGNLRGVSVSLRNLGLLAAQQRDFESARSFYEEALPIARSHGDNRVVASLAHGLATVRFADGDHHGASQLAEEGLGIARQLGDRQLIAEILTVLSGVSAAEGNDRLSASRLEESLVLWRALGSRDGVAWAHTTLGEMALAAGDLRGAGRHLRTALDAWRRIGDDAAVARIASTLGQCAFLLGDADAAGQSFEEALELAARVADDGLRAAALQGLGDVARLQGDLAYAQRLYDQSLEVAARTGWKRLLWGPMLGLAVVARERGEAERALELLRQSIALRPGLGRRLGTAGCLDEVAAVLVAHSPSSGSAMASAARLLGAAESLRKEVAAEIPPVRTAPYSALVEEVRRALGDDFGPAWTSGLAMSAEEAVALACSPGLLEW
jgi:predicted ATPase/class 3 adenylate cyclase/Tfp pilus assembly protein PilF